jgi:hypothetical protein
MALQRTSVRPECSLHSRHSRQCPDLRHRNSGGARDHHLRSWPPKRLAQQYPRGPNSRQSDSGVSVSKRRGGRHQPKQAEVNGLCYMELQTEGVCNTATGKTRLACTRLERDRWPPCQHRCTWQAPVHPAKTALCVGAPIKSVPIEPNFAPAHHRSAVFMHNALHAVGFSIR